MTTAINEACIEWLYENCYFVRVIFLVAEMNIFYFWPRFFFHPQGFLRTVGLGEGTGQSIHAGGNKQDEGGEMMDIGGIIQVDIFAGHCIVLGDLILINFFK